MYQTCAKKNRDSHGRVIEGFASMFKDPWWDSLAKKSLFAFFKFFSLMRWTKWKEYLPFFIYWNVFALANRSLLNSRKLLFNPLSANPTKWPNTLKQSDLLTNCLRVLDHFVKLALTGLTCFLALWFYINSPNRIFIIKYIYFLTVSFQGFQESI